MNISKKTSLIVLAITSLVFSRTMFALFNDPEGPNLLVVTVVAAIIYTISLAAYAYLPLIKQDGAKKLALMILIQALVVTGFYFGLN